jgi:hypothetical protein
VGAVSRTVLAAAVLASSIPRGAAASDVPPEIGLGAGQLLIGAATATVALAIPVFAQDTPFELLALGALFAGPAAVASMVCKLGQTSKHYVGGCGPTVGGAYLGALVGVPFALLAIGDSDSGESGIWGTDYGAPAFIGFLIGYGLGTAAGATIAWHASKQERSVWSRLGPPPPAPSAAGDGAWPDLRRRAPAGARGPAALTVPLLAFTF